MRIRTHTNPFTVRERFTKIKLEEVFSNYSKKLDLEIGFGNGLFLQNYAISNPDRSIIGVEARKRMAEWVKKNLEKEKIENIHIVFGNGLICLQDMFEDNVIDNIFIFHPDPWVKRRQQNRRVINEDFLNLAKMKLKKLGKIFVSTDVECLWKDILKLFDADKDYVYFPKDEFWEGSYFTRWSEISAEKKRHVYFGMFQLK